VRILFLLVVMFAPLGIIQAQEWDADKYKTKGGVTLFWEACVHQYPDRENFAAWIKLSGFKEFAPDAAAGIAKEPGGRAWVIDNAGVRYLLVAEESNLCTVYMKSFDLDIFSTSFETGQRSLATNGWIKFDNVSRETRLSGDINFTNYRYTNHGDSVLNITVADVMPGTSFFELGMTATMTRMANKPLQPIAPKNGAPVDR